MNKKMLIFSIIIIILIVVGVFWFRNRNLEKAVIEYKGDGKIKDISWNFAGFLPVLGYSIDFPDFDLSKSYNTIYSLGNLPKYLHKVGIYLLIKDARSKWPDERKKSLEDGHIIIKIKNNKGKPIKEVNQLLKNMRWSDERGGLGAYDSVNSFFNPADTTNYTIEVKYWPDNGLEGLKGSIYIRAGGSI